MLVLDVEALAGEISSDAPCGPNLEYDAAYLELERLAQGKAETQVGDHISPAEPPDWKAVRSACLKLLERTRDLRVATTLAQAQLAQDGVAGFSPALDLIERLVRERWPDVHPQLDADDDNDPAIRVNALLALVDGATVLRAFRAAPLASSRALGRVCLRDIEVAHGEADAAEGQEAPTTASIDAVFLDVPIEDLQRDATALRSALEALHSIEATLTAHVGAARAVDFGPLARLVRRASDFTAERAARRGGAAAAADGAGETGAGVAAAASGAPPRPGEIAGRADVIRLIDQICDYYQRHEPASPVPLMLLRARRLAMMNFLEIIEELAPDGLAQVRQVGGIVPP
jgi:type VI secretion system protein ImpA